MKRHFLQLGALVLLSALLGACLPRSVQPSPTVDLNALYTQVASTLTASAPTATQSQVPTQTPWVITATHTNTALPTNTPWIVTATYTNTATPSNTPLVTNTPTKTLTPKPSSTPQAVCNRAELIAHVTVPRGTFMAPDKPFTKIWRLKNTGTCEWNNTYKLIFSSGTNMAEKNSYLLTGLVKPGNTIDLAVEMRSPKKNGEYGSQWMLFSNKGETFGLNANAKGPITLGLLVSNQVNGSYRYDFAANACMATWRNTAGPLPCPGNASGTQGYVIPTLAPVLETRHEDEPGLWVQPNHAANGYVRGIFPEFKVATGDRFVAALGCHGDSPKCHVRFTLSYINKNGVEKELGSWEEKNDDDLTQVDIDLSSLADAIVRFVLSVEPLNNNYDQADGIWFLPSIRK
ncbi:MAG: NBR1-Ig-like domain-containing protein [Anaerolineales bacterium]